MIPCCPVENWGDCTAFVKGFAAFSSCWQGLGICKKKHRYKQKNAACPNGTRSVMGCFKRRA